MGTQIGAVFALGGFDVAVCDVSVEALARSEEEAGRRIARLVEKAALTVEEAEGALSRLRWTGDMNEAASSADFVLEAATEQLDVKRRIFAELDEAAPAHTIFATNSSTIPSSQIAEASGRADRVCNVHFFNPALMMKCVEVVPNPVTSMQTMTAVLGMVERIGKHPVQLSTEVPGFIANRLMMALQDEAIALHEQGVASLEDIDATARLALGHPMGPFELMDLVGLDVITFMHEAIAALTEDPVDPPAVSLAALVDVGDLGKKSGRGWYSYDTP